MANIPVGAKGEAKLLVTAEVAINFLGLDEARVLSTPQMIGFMERTCRQTVLPLLDAGDDTVGTHVNIAHLAGAPLGSVVTAKVQILAVDGRRIDFKVEAWRDDEKIGEGTHQRTVINVAKFASRMTAKKN